MPKPYYERGGITIYHGDCREILPSLAGFDFILSDPPYGISFRAKEQQYAISAQEFNHIKGDEGMDLRFLLNRKEPMIIFGASNFPEQLPHRGRWICWDKRTAEHIDKCPGSPFELAWSNAKSGFYRMYRCLHVGYTNANNPGVRREHPTEKPFALMRAILRDFPKASCILDPFMGSGTTLRAAKDLNRRAIGIEIEERYCEIAARRLSQEVFAFE